MADHEGRLRHRVDLPLHLPLLLPVTRRAAPLLPLRLAALLLVVAVLHPLQVAVVRPPLARLRKPAHDRQPEVQRAQQLLHLARPPVRLVPLALLLQRVARLQPLAEAWPSAPSPLLLLQKVGDEPRVAELVP